MRTRIRGSADEGREQMNAVLVGVGEYNEGYLDAKRDRMGHQLPTHEVLDAQIDDALEAQGRSAR